MPDEDEPEFHQDFVYTVRTGRNKLFDFVPSLSTTNAVLSVGSTFAEKDIRRIVNGFLYKETCTDNTDNSNDYNTKYNGFKKAGENSFLLHICFRGDFPLFF